MENQTNVVALISNQLQQFSLSLLAGRDEKVIEGKISAIDNRIIFEPQCLCTAEDELDKSAIRANITVLQAERRELSISLVKASDMTLSLIGPSPGTIVSTPQPIIASPSSLIAPSFSNVSNVTPTSLLPIVSSVPSISVSVSSVSPVSSSLSSHSLLPRGCSATKIVGINMIFSAM